MKKSLFIACLIALATSLSMCSNARSTQLLDKYEGKPEMEETDTGRNYQYSYDSLSYELSIAEEDFKFAPLLEGGYVHPKLWEEYIDIDSTMSVCCFKEQNSTVLGNRIYTFLLYSSERMFPFECTVELAGDKRAKSDEEFLADAQILSFDYREEE